MDIDNKLNLGLTYKLYINYLLRKQFLLPVYIILTTLLLLACIINLSPLFIDTVFTLSNIYLIIIYFSDNEKSFHHFRNIYNVNDFMRLFIKISLSYLFWIAQIIIIWFSGSGISPDLISFYTFLVSSILCLFILAYEIKKNLLKISALIVSALILFKLYLSILGNYAGLLILMSLMFITLVYSVTKLQYEANHYF